jgi:hypothetical protein
MSIKANYNQPDESAILLDSITDIEPDDLTMPISVKYDLYLSSVPIENRQTGFEGYPVIEIRYGDYEKDYKRVNMETAISHILNPHETTNKHIRTGAILQHAILKAIEKDLIDAGTVGRALGRAFSAGRVGNAIIGERILSTLFAFSNHPLILEEQQQLYQSYASDDYAEEMQYNEMVDELNRSERAAGYKSPSERVASGELEPGEDGFEDYIDEMAAKHQGDE